MSETARCYYCKQDVAVERFVPDRAKASGRSSICRDCDRAKGRRYYEANREKVRAAHNARPKPPRKPHKCRGCGRSYEAKASQQRYCTEECAKKYQRKVSSVPRSCERCDKTYIPGDTRQRFCSRTCAYEDISARAIRYKLSIGQWVGQPCRVCRTSVLLPSRRHAPYCSDRCRYAFYSLGLAVHDVRICAECGTQWERWANPGRQVYCSDTCSARVARRVMKRRRRARQRAAKVESVDLKQVAERDGWRCHICKHKVTQKTWSLDHLVPLSYGGEHSYRNVALAHHRCNTLRSNKGAAQLRPTG